VPNSPPGAIPPVSPIPNSQTPQPSPTDLPTPTDVATATPCVQGCGGGGGGGGGGGSGTVTASASPATWIHGQGAAILVHTTPPNTGINIILKFPSGETFLDNGCCSTNGAGDYTYSFTVPSDCTSGRAHAVIEAGFGNGSHIQYYDLYTPCG
jgi:hypothetical protein